MTTGWAERTRLSTASEIATAIGVAATLAMWWRLRSLGWPVAARRRGELWGGGDATRVNPQPAIGRGISQHLDEESAIN